MDSNVYSCAYPLSSRKERNFYVFLLQRVVGSGHRETREVTLAESPEVLLVLNCHCLGAAFIAVRQMEREGGGHRCWSLEVGKGVLLIVDG